MRRIEAIDFFYLSMPEILDIADGGQEAQCGWLKDRYGLSWQVVPAEWEAMLTDPDAEKVARVTRAMLGMVRLDIAALHAAAEG